jgi:hypothetical protein
MSTSGITMPGSHDHAESQDWGEIREGSAGWTIGRDPNSHGIAAITLDRI